MKDRIDRRMIWKETNMTQVPINEAQGPATRTEQIVANYGARGQSINPI